MPTALSILILMPVYRKLFELNVCFRNQKERNPLLVPEVYVRSVHCLLLVVFVTVCSQAQSPSVPSASIPRIIRFSGIAPPGVSSATFAIYDSQDSTTPLWLETQSVTADETGHYSVLLGATASEGLPLSIFANANAHWIGVKIGQADESPRSLLVSVPYAMKAVDADTLGGKPLSAFVLSEQSNSPTSATEGTTSAKAKRLLETGKAPPENNGMGDLGTQDHLAKFVTTGSMLGDSALVESGGNLGIGTITPHFPLEIVGSNVEFLQRNPDASAYSGMRFYNDQNSGVRALEIDYSGSAYSSALVAGGPVGESALVTSTGPFPLTLGTNNTARITVSGSGNVGIGTNNPHFPLELVGSNVEFLQRNPDPLSYSGLRFYNDQNNALRALEMDYSGSSYSGVLLASGPVGESAALTTTGPFPFALGTSNTARMTITGAGNIGINQVAPLGKLHISGGVNTSLVLDNSSLRAGRFSFYVGDGTGGSLADENYIRSANTGLHFLAGATGTTENVSFLVNGNVGINNTAPVAKLDVSQTAAGIDPSSFSVGTAPPSAVHGDTTATSGSIAGVFGTTSSVDGFGVLGENLASGTGTGISAGVLGVTANVSGSNVTNLGTGVWGEARQGGGDNVGVFGRSASVIGTGVVGQATSVTNEAVGVYGTSASSSGTGVFGEATSTSVGSPIPAGIFGRSAAGTAGLFTVTNNSAMLLIGENASGANVFRVDSTGHGFFDGSTTTGGADFAESVDVAEQKSTYEPGDVMAIDTKGVRRFAKVSQPYSTLVAGIYSTKPGVLATKNHVEDPRISSIEIPLAVVGIVPCKVTNENGDINAGDLLVSSSTAGFAMKGTDRSKMTGAVVGKALQALHGKSGVIEVLVSLQ